MRIRGPLQCPTLQCMLYKYYDSVIAISGSFTQHILLFFHRESIEIECHAKRQAISKAVVPCKSRRHNLEQDIAAAAGDD